MHRAFSVLSVKEVDDEKRIITGIASTPTPDRVGDIVEPMGAMFKTPMPLLLYHKHDQPVGAVDFAKPNKTGIPFKAHLPIVEEEGRLKERVDEAWHSVKYKLLTAVSIGFKAVEDGVELLKNGGLRFTVWEWLELSLVSVPAQPDAVIQTFKSAHTPEFRAALRLSQAENDEERKALVTLLRSKAATGHEKAAVKLICRKSPGASGPSPAGRPGSVQYLPRKS